MPHSAKLNQHHTKHSFYLTPIAVYLAHLLNEAMAHEHSMLINQDGNERVQLELMPPLMPVLTQGGDDEINLETLTSNEMSTIYADVKFKMVIDQPELATVDEVMPSTGPSLVGSSHDINSDLLNDAHLITHAYYATTSDETSFLKAFNAHYSEMAIDATDDSNASDSSWVLYTLAGVGVALGVAGVILASRDQPKDNIKFYVPPDSIIPVATYQAMQNHGDFSQGYILRGNSADLFSPDGQLKEYIDVSYLKKVIVVMKEDSLMEALKDPLFMKVREAITTDHHSIEVVLEIAPKDDIEVEFISDFSEPDSSAAHPYQLDYLFIDEQFKHLSIEEALEELSLHGKRVLLEQGEIHSRSNTEGSQEITGLYVAHVKGGTYLFLGKDQALEVEFSWEEPYESIETTEWKAFVPHEVNMDGLFKKGENFRVLLDDETNRNKILINNLGESNPTVTVDQLGVISETSTFKTINKNELTLESTYKDFKDLFNQYVTENGGITIEDNTTLFISEINIIDPVKANELGFLLYAQENIEGISAAFELKPLSDNFFGFNIVDTLNNINDEDNKVIQNLTKLKSGGVTLSVLVTQEELESRQAYDLLSNTEGKPFYLQWVVSPSTTHDQEGGALSLETVITGNLSEINGTFTKINADSTIELIHDSSANDLISLSNESMPVRIDFKEAGADTIIYNGNSDQSPLNKFNYVNLEQGSNLDVYIHDNWNTGLYIDFVIENPTFLASLMSHELEDIENILNFEYNISDSNGAIVTHTLKEMIENVLKDIKELDFVSKEGEIDYIEVNVVSPSADSATAELKLLLGIDDKNNDNMIDTGEAKPYFMIEHTGDENNLKIYRKDNLLNEEDYAPSADGWKYIPDQIEAMHAYSSQSFHTMMELGLEPDDSMF